MNSPQHLRVWRGWKREDIDDGNFMTALQQTFVPATCLIMSHYGLQCYVPSALKGGDTELPDEVALLFYSTEEQYKRHKTQWIGRHYSNMHSELFRFKDPKRPNSKSTVGLEPSDSTPSLPDLPAWWKRATGQGLTLSGDSGSAVFVVLKNGTQPVSAATLLSLVGKDDEAVVFVDSAFTLIWLAIADATNPETFTNPLAIAVGATVATAHVISQQPVPPDLFAPYAGAAIDWDKSLRFTL